MRLLEGGQVLVGLLQPGLQEALHAVLGRRSPAGVAVEELGDLLARRRPRRPSSAGPSRCWCRRPWRSGWTRPVLEHDALGRCPSTRTPGRPWPRPSAARFGALAAICQVSIGASSAASASYWVPSVGNGKKSRSAMSSGFLVAANTLDMNRPSRYMPGLLLEERRRGVRPLQARRSPWRGTAGAPPTSGTRW